MTTAQEIREGLKLFGQVQVQTPEGPRPLQDFTPYGNEERTGLTLGNVYRGGQWVKITINEEG